MTCELLLYNIAGPSLTCFHRYLHLGCRAPTRLVNRERVRLVWTILRLRHPLLASTVKMHNYDDVRFV